MSLFSFSALSNWVASVSGFCHFGVEDDVMKPIPTFGAEQWKTYLNLDVDVPDIPDKIQKAMEERCPFWANKTGKETHFLCLVPGELSLSDLYKLTGAHTNSPYINDATEKTKFPYWILITKKNVPDSENLDLEEQVDRLHSFGYHVPSDLEAAIAVLGAKYLNKLSLYPAPRQYTRCNKKFNDYPCAIGSDRTAPFGIYTNDWQNLYGVAAVLRS